MCTQLFFLCPAWCDLIRLVNFICKILFIAAHSMKCFLRKVCKTPWPESHPRPKSVWRKVLPTTSKLSVPPLRIALIPDVVHPAPPKSIPVGIILLNLLLRNKKKAERNQNFNLPFGGHFHFAPSRQFPRLDIQVKVWWQRDELLWLHLSWDKQKHYFYFYYRQMKHHHTWESAMNKPVKPQSGRGVWGWGCWLGSFQ